MRRVALPALAALMFACEDKSPAGADTAVRGDGLIPVDIIDEDGDGYDEVEDCDDADASVYPEADELCDDVDNDCDAVVDEDPVDASAWYADADADGFGGDYEVVSCDLPSGYTADSSDCDDTDALIHPGADEICNAIDDDCDDAVDEDALDPGTWYGDGDGDGYGDAEDVVEACEAPSGYDRAVGDCDDDDPEINPAAQERCDDRDQDCDDLVDEDALDARSWYADGDGDGYGDDGTEVVSCDADPGSVGVGGDCDDADAASYPGALELCDGAQNDCDDAGWSDDDGLVSFQSDADGSWTDLTTSWAAGLDGSPASYSFADPGAAWICAGLWYVNLDVDGVDVSLTGLDGTSAVVLSGGGSGPVVYAEGAALRLSELTIQDGIAENGAGVYLYDAAADLEALDIEDNVSEDAGGGIYARASELSLTDCDLTGNEAFSGGALYATDGASVLLESSEIKDNDAWDGGGVMLYTDVTLEATDLTLTDNRADDDGGGLFGATRATVTLTDSRIYDNGSEAGGGLLIFDESAVTLDNVEIDGNTADYGAGLFVGDACSADALDLVLSDNDADGSGGGFYCGIDSSVDLTDASIVGNTALASGGGGFLYDNCVLTDDGGEVTGNVADSAGGGFALIDASALDLTDTLFTANAADYGGAVYLEESDALFDVVSATGNAAGYGGAVFFNSSSSLKAYGGEVSSNIALASGGGLYVYESEADLDSVVLDGNSATYGGAIYIYDALVSGSTCDFSGNSPDDTFGHGYSYTLGAGATFSCSSAGCY